MSAELLAIKTGLDIVTKIKSMMPKKDKVLNDKEIEELRKVLYDIIDTAIVGVGYIIKIRKPRGISKLFYDLFPDNIDNFETFKKDIVKLDNELSETDYDKLVNRLHNELGDDFIFSIITAYELLKVYAIQTKDWEELNVIREEIDYWENELKKKEIE